MSNDTYSIALIAAVVVVSGGLMALYFFTIHTMHKLVSNITKEQNKTFERLDDEHKKLVLKLVREQDQRQLIQMGIQAGIQDHQLSSQYALQKAANGHSGVRIYPSVVNIMHSYMICKELGDNKNLDELAQIISRAEKHAKKIKSWYENRTPSENSSNPTQEAA